MVVRFVVEDNRVRSIRVSTNKDSQEESLATQKCRLQQIVKNTPDWTLYRIYEDQDSDKDMFRLGFQSMMCDAIDKFFDIILVKSISRFSRNSIEALEKVKELRWLGIELRAEDENISTQENQQDFEMTIRLLLHKQKASQLNGGISSDLKEESHNYIGVSALDIIKMNMVN